MRSENCRRFGLRYPTPVKPLEHVGLRYPRCPPKARSKQLVPSSRTLKKLHAAIVAGPTKLTSIGNFGLRYPLAPRGTALVPRTFVPPAGSVHGYPRPRPAAIRIGHWYPELGHDPPEFQTLRTYRSRPPASASAHDANSDFGTPGPSAEVTGVAARYAVTGASSLLHESLSANLIGQPAVFPRLSQLVLGSAAVNPKVGPRQKFIQRGRSDFGTPSSDVRQVAHKPFRTLEPQFSDVSTPEYWLSSGLKYPLLIIKSNILLIAGGPKVRTCFSTLWTT